MEGIHLLVSVSLSVCLSVCPSVCLSLCPSVCMCLSVRLLVHVSVCLSVCLCGSTALFVAIDMNAMLMCRSQIDHWRHSRTRIDPCLQSSWNGATSQGLVRLLKEMVSMVNKRTPCISQSSLGVTASPHHELRNNRYPSQLASSLQGV